MKVILCGYNWAGCKALDYLTQNGQEVFVYTHESPGYVNDLASYCRKIMVPCTLSRIRGENLPFQPDIVVSVYYRCLIGKEVIDTCGGRIFNLHPSLLPRYRGCSSLTWAMIKGEKYAGYSYHYIDTGIDTGNILLQRPVRIEGFDTQVTLYHRVMFAAMGDFSTAFDLVCRGFSGFPQQRGISGEYYKRGCPYDGIINPAWSGDEKERYIRAMIYPPLEPARWNGKPVWKMKEVDGALIKDSVPAGAGGG